MKELFWVSDPSVLLDSQYISNIWPKRHDDVDTKLNAVTRCVILMTVIGLILTRNSKLRLCITTIVTLIAVVFYQNYIHKIKSVIENNKENFTSRMNTSVQNSDAYRMIHGSNGLQNPTTQNPLMNVNVTDVKYNPRRQPAQPSYNKEIRQTIRDNIKSNLDPRLFRDLGDEMNFNQFERQLYTMPNSEVPNNQQEFAKFCYGNTAIEKDTNLKASKCDDLIYSR